VFDGTVGSGDIEGEGGEEGEGEERRRCSIMERRGATPVPGPMQMMGVEGEEGRERVPGVIRKDIGEPTDEWEEARLLVSQEAGLESMRGKKRS
jgi:hypothetical protein